MRTNLPITLIVAALSLLTSACLLADEQPSPKASHGIQGKRTGETQPWAWLGGYKHRFDNMGGCEFARALPGGYMEFTYAYGSGCVETCVYLLGPLEGERRYGVLFDAHRTGGQGDSFKVQGDTVLYHFECASWGKPVDKVYPLSEEGAGEFRRDKRALLRGSAGNPGALVSEDGSLLLVCYNGCNLFVRSEDGVTYRPAAAVSVSKPVQSISREGDTLILHAKDGSECRIPILESQTRLLAP